MISNSTLHELTPEIKIWGCPRCNTVGIGIAKDMVLVKCGTGCVFSWEIKNTDFKEAIVAWNQLIVNQTADYGNSKWNL